MSCSYKGVPMLHVTKAATSCTFITIFALSTSLRDDHPLSYTAKREVPLMTKEVLYGIWLPLHVPLPHAVWMIPQMGVLCDGMRLVLQAPNRLYQPDYCNKFPYHPDQRMPLMYIYIYIYYNLHCIYVSKV